MQRMEGEESWREKGGRKTKDAGTEIREEKMVRGERAGRSSRNGKKGNEVESIENVYVYNKNRGALICWKYVKPSDFTQLSLYSVITVTFHSHQEIQEPMPRRYMPPSLETINFRVRKVSFRPLNHIVTQSCVGVFQYG